MNKAFLIGRLTRDPELRQTGSNIPVANFSIAVNRTFTNASGEREADFINVIVWRKAAENVKNYLNKGSLVGIDGRIQTRTYQTNNGETRYVTEVVAERVQFLESKAQSQNRGQGSNSYNNSESAPAMNAGEDPFANFGDNIEMNDIASDDDLPF